MSRDYARALGERFSVEAPAPELLYLEKLFFLGTGPSRRMADLKRELHLLISIAKVDESIHKYRNELGALPGRIERIMKSIKKINASDREAKEHFERMKKERRELEQSLQDRAELIVRYKTQLMSVKTNKEYQAMLKEIETLERDIDEREEKLLILMDEIDAQSETNDEFFEKMAREKDDLQREKADLEARRGFLEAELEKLGNEKPKFLAELDPQIKKRYERIMDKLGNSAVAHIEEDICQGCFARIPPQRVHEVRKNDRIIICEGCGRILVYYAS